MSKIRTVNRIVSALEQSEGLGARVRRSIGSASMKNFSPFLLFDHFNLSPYAGFPDHPHRGQETITYMLKGKVDHEDFTGAKGTLGPGDLQFMTAGRGVVHAEMPHSERDPDTGTFIPIEGLQLWLDLPEAKKIAEPRYHDLHATQIPVAKTSDGIEVKVIAGEALDVKVEPDVAYTPVWMLDYKVNKGGFIYQPFPKNFNVFLYVLEGAVTIQGETYDPFSNVFFNTDGDAVEVSVQNYTDSHNNIIKNDEENSNWKAANDTDQVDNFEKKSKDNEASRFLLVGGEILNQPVVQFGPFVETSRDKIRQAMLDYSHYQNGFERAEGWISEIGKHML